MLILVANLGSTSFKYKLFDLMPDSETVLAEGASDRIGNPPSAWEVEADGREAAGEADLPDHGAAIDLHLEQLTKLSGFDVSSLDAIGFKAVHGGSISAPTQVDDDLLAVMERFSDVAPAHNPPYIAAMRAFAERLPKVPQVAAFETGYHQSIPLKRQTYAIPYEWTTDLGIRRYGFHGASHRYIATRLGEIAPECRKVISCHIGGSSSISAINGGKSEANSFGMTAQTGIPHGGRVGDFDTFALLKLLQAGMDLDTIFNRLGKEGGLAAIGGVGSDMRDIEAAAASGNERAQLAFDVLIESVRHYVGAYLAVLNGADAICFTGGIGQHSKAARAAILQDMDYAGIVMDPAKNETANGSQEGRIDASGSGTQLWVLPTNEELIVARQTAAVLSG